MLTRDGGQVFLLVTQTLVPMAFHAIILINLGTQFQIGPRPHPVLGIHGQLCQVSRHIGDILGTAENPRQ